jgi:hypothetical protein
VLTLGAEFIDNVHQDQQFRYLNPTVPVFAAHRASTQEAVYVQDEIKIRPWLIANGGLRFDRYEEFSRTTPRAALIVMPSASQSFNVRRSVPCAKRLRAQSFYFGDAPRACVRSRLILMSSWGALHERLAANLRLDLRTTPTT